MMTCKNVWILSVLLKVTIVWQSAVSQEGRLINFDHDSLVGYFNRYYYVCMTIRLNGYYYYVK